MCKLCSSCVKSCRSSLMLSSWMKKSLPLKPEWQANWLLADPTGFASPGSCKSCPLQKNTKYWVLDGLSNKINKANHSALRPPPDPFCLCCWSMLKPLDCAKMCKGAGYGFPRDLLRHGLTKIRPWRMLAFHKSRVMQCRSIIRRDSFTKKWGNDRKCMSIRHSS